MKIYKYILLGLLAGIQLMTSCSEILEVNTDDMALEENNFQSLSEVYSGLLGVSSAFQQAAEHYVLLAELRGDAIEPTNNAPLDFWEVYRYKQQPNNTLISPMPFYKIVLNANDYLRHIVRFNQENPNAMASEIYKGIVSTAITYRTWAYLTIGKFYGEAVYYDLALVDDTDLSKQPLLQFDELILELISFMKQGVDGVDGYNTLEWSKFLDPSTNAAAADWYYQSVNANVLMCELQLWANNSMEAVLEGLKAVSSGTEANGNLSLERYKLSSSFEKSKWKQIFTNSYGAIANEAFTCVPFDNSKNQTHKLQYFCSNIRPSVYYIKPHKSLRFDDYRNSSTTFEAGLNCIAKYHIGKKSYEQDKFIYVYRASEVWLMIAEGLSNMGNIYQADTLLNNGMASCWSGSKFNPPFDKPIYTTNLQGNKGVRGRAEAKLKHIRDFVVDSLYLDDNVLQSRKKIVIDSLIADEYNQELAFEGKRWFTLLRMARNANNPTILATPIASKFDAAERPFYTIWLRDPKNWFIKYNHLKQ